MYYYSCTKSPSYVYQLMKRRSCLLLPTYLISKCNIPYPSIRPLVRMQNYQDSYQTFVHNRDCQIDQHIAFLGFDQHMLSIYKLPNIAKPTKVKLWQYCSCSHMAFPKLNLINFRKKVELEKSVFSVTSSLLNLHMVFLRTGYSFSKSWF